jgi:putative NIF3 family GTP cyclohydrolase 1 type 2
MSTWARAMAAPITAQQITAQQIVDRIQKSTGGEWKPDTVDTFKAGDPSANVTGIVTTSLATLDVLAQAVKSGANMIITSEPTFFSRADTPTPTRRPFGGGAGRGAGGPGGPGRPGASATAAAIPPPPAPPPPDPVFTGKNDFIKKNNLIIWRFSDHWGQRTPNPFAQGLLDTMGWSKSASGDPSQVTIPHTSLDALVTHVKTSLRSRGGMRIVGDPKLQIRTVALLPGSTPIDAALKALPNADVILAGEVREWETVEYVRDTIDMGGKKALILTGRVVSESPGMQLCAQWIKTLVPEVPSTWMPVTDPYWRPTL